MMEINPQEQPFTFMIRIANQNDLNRVVEIYNQAVRMKFQTADTVEVSTAERETWFQFHLDPNYPIIIVDEDNEVRGWLSISPYRAGREALKGCVEISYYVDQGHLRRGIGSTLITESLKLCRSLKYHSVFAIILDRNESSIALMKKFGFSQWAHMPEIANINGERCGHVYYGRHL